MGRDEAASWLSLAMGDALEGENQHRQELSRLGRDLVGDPGPSCSTLHSVADCSELSGHGAMGHGPYGEEMGGWNFWELELSGHDQPRPATTSHDPCGLRAHLEQGTGTCAKPRRERREVPRALGGCL
jgi:hypothetical protein